MNACAILIPVYQPKGILFELVKSIQQELVLQHCTAPIWVVNDGSSADCDELFLQIGALSGAQVLRHAVNLGKGAALKTGINAILTQVPQVGSIITADGDGQHAPQDIVRLVRKATQDASRLYLGSRQFDSNVPLRSRFGNVITRGITRFLTGLSLSDTQTGLRAIPRDLCEVALHIPLNGYDFEMECLVAFRRTHAGQLLFEEVPVHTVYIDGNRSSHFNPLFDSMRIYFVFLRYCAGSLITFMIDYVIFLLVFAQSQSIGLGIVLARAVAIFVSFFFNRQAVFQARGRAVQTFVRFLILVAALGWISYLATSYLARTFAIPPSLSKLLVEAVLFFASFALNNTFVFDRPSRDSARTDWDDYYSRPYRTAGITRRITTQLLIRLMRRYGSPKAHGLKLLELGGANSCFIDALRKAVAPSEYHIVDNNQTGLARSRNRTGPQDPIFMHEIDLLTQTVPVHADITFSVGLIEHFDVAGTARLIDEHFLATREGGLVIISFPTATWLYRMIRGLAEWLGIWIFFDERPLSEHEVRAAALGRGRLLYSRINWAIGLTQCVMVFRRESASAESGTYAAPESETGPAVFPDRATLLK